MFYPAQRSHDVLGIEVKEAGGQYTASTDSFPNLQSVCSCSVLTVASCPVYRFLRRLVRWSGIPISKNILQFVVINTVKSFKVVNKAQADGFLEVLCFFYDLMDVGN